eukprot:CAMPEP_0171720782 /NCGR_PEP_ID=MMETSP0991-20121206/21984_1 /TAXON_ID=483369 /ORGANISM="non described non described, Strain CCMP2098" /LENGTH=51 /DNA_ID=CAMNT_0012312557 /DNA_START=153 /DNA_END=305 /DNA_ORIENTATION=-
MIIHRGQHVRGHQGQAKGPLTCSATDMGLQMEHCSCQKTEVLLVGIATPGG